MLVKTIIQVQDFTITMFITTICFNTMCSLSPQYYLYCLKYQCDVRFYFCMLLL